MDTKYRGKGHSHIDICAYLHAHGLMLLFLELKTVSIFDIEMFSDIGAINVKVCTFAKSLRRLME